MRMTVSRERFDMVRMECLSEKSGGPGMRSVGRKFGRSEEKANKRGKGQIQKMLKMQKRSHDVIENKRPAPGKEAKTNW